MFLYIILGIFICSVFIEPLIINFIYFSNIDLFIDIILTKSNEFKLYHCVLKRLEKEDNKGFDI